MVAAVAVDAVVRQATPGSLGPVKARPRDVVAVVAAAEVPKCSLTSPAVAKRS